MKIRHLLAFQAVIFLFYSCSHPDKTPKDILRTTFNCIKNNDWERFKPFVITQADILVKTIDLKIKPSQRKSSYAYGVLKPEHLKDMKERFEKAAKGGNGLIDFSDSRFIGEGAFFEDKKLSPEEGGIYSLKINTSKKSIDTGDMYPKFMIIKWEGVWKVHKIMFKDDFELRGTPVRLPRKF